MGRDWNEGIDEAFLALSQKILQHYKPSPEHRRPKLSTGYPQKCRSYPQPLESPKKGVIGQNSSLGYHHTIMPSTAQIWPSGNAQEELYTMLDKYNGKIVRAEFYMLVEGVI